MSKSYKDFPSWIKTVELIKVVYEITSSWPESEKFGLTNQIRRAAVSIASNIAEGYGRYDAGDKRHFLSIARGSTYEVEAQLILSCELGFTKDVTTVLEITQEVCALLHAAREAVR